MQRCSSQWAHLFIFNSADGPNLDSNATGKHVFVVMFSLKCFITELFFTQSVFSAVRTLLNNYRNCMCVLEAAVFLIDPLTLL